MIYKLYFYFNLDFTKFVIQNLKKDVEGQLIN